MKQHKAPNQPSFSLAISTPILYIGMPGYPSLTGARQHRAALWAVKIGKRAWKCHLSTVAAVKEALVPLASG